MKNDWGLIGEKVWLNGGVIGACCHCKMPTIAKKVDQNERRTLKMVTANNDDLSGIENAVVKKNNEKRAKESVYLYKTRGGMCSECISKKTERKGKTNVGGSSNGVRLLRSEDFG